MGEISAPLSPRPPVKQTSAPADYVNRGNRRAKLDLVSDMLRRPCISLLSASLALGRIDRTGPQESVGTYISAVKPNRRSSKLLGGNTGVVEEYQRSADTSTIEVVHGNADPQFKNASNVFSGERRRGVKSLPLACMGRQFRFAAIEVTVVTSPKFKGQFVAIVVNRERPNRLVCGVKNQPRIVISDKPPIAVGDAMRQQASGKAFQCRCHGCSADNERGASPR